MKKMKKKMPAKKKGPMKLEEMEEAHSNVNNLASADMVGLATDYGNPDVINAIPSAKEKDVLPDVKNKWQAASAKLVLPMKLQDKSANNKATPGRVESAGNKSFKFGRKELFDESALPDHYPLHHVKSILSKLKSQAADTQELILDFTGIEQLTDFVFYLLLTSHDEALKKVTEVNITGCLHVTDQGLIWMASAFTGLKVFLNFREETTLSPLMDLLWSFNEVNKWLHLLRAICDYNVENECGLLNRLVTGMMVKRKKRKDSVYIYTVYHHVL